MTQKEIKLQRGMHILYWEIFMLEGTYNRLTDKKNPLIGIEGEACLESFLTHTRNCLEFFKVPDSNNLQLSIEFHGINLIKCSWLSEKICKDSLHCTNFIKGIDFPAIKMPPGNGYNEICTYLSHPSWKRKKETGLG